VQARAAITSIAVTTHRSIVSASSRQGITTETSGSAGTTSGSVTAAGCADGITMRG
jgi:hypothetical protein